MSQARVSVITTAYDVAPYLGEAIESVLAQTYRSFEYVIIDDGSNDSSLEIARLYGRIDPRIRVISVPHGGAGSARNHALRACRTDLVAFLDGDDVWDRNFLERHLAHFDSEPEDCAGSFCWSRGIDHLGNPRRMANVPNPGRYGLYEMLRGVCPPGNGSSLLLRRNLILEAGLFDEAMPTGQDTEMWYRILEKFPDRYLSCLPEVLISYRRRPGSLTDTRLLERIASKPMVIRRYARSLARRQKFEVYLSLGRYAERKKAQEQLRFWSVEAAKASFPRLFLSYRGFFSLLVIFLGPALAKKARALLNLRQRTPKNKLSRWISYWYQTGAGPLSEPATLLELGEPSPSIAQFRKNAERLLVTRFEGQAGQLFQQYPPASFDTVIAPDLLAVSDQSERQEIISAISRLSRKRIAISVPTQDHAPRLSSLRSQISRELVIEDEYECPVDPSRYFFECAPKNLMSE